MRRADNGGSLARYSICLISSMSNQQKNGGQGHSGAAGGSKKGRDSQSNMGSGGTVDKKGTQGRQAPPAGDNRRAGDTDGNAEGGNSKSKGAVNPADPRDADEDVPVTKESSRGGHEPAPELNDRADQNVAYDEVVKGRALTDEERSRAERESPLS